MCGPAAPSLPPPPRSATASPTVVSTALSPFPHLRHHPTYLNTPHDGGVSTQAGYLPPTGHAPHHHLPPRGASQHVRAVGGK